MHQPDFTELAASGQLVCLVGRYAPGYAVSSTGRVWSSRKRINLGNSRGCKIVLTDEWREITPRYEGRRHKVRIGGLTLYVHALVLEAFGDPCPPGMECCHFNGVASDNRLENLRWDTHKSNMCDDRFRNDGMGCAKLVDVEVRKIRELHAGGLSKKDLAAMFGVDRSVVSDIVHCKTWKHVV